jgi:hypothetical protein
MSALFKKPSAGDEQMCRIQRQVEALDLGIRYLSTHLPQKTMTEVGDELAGAAMGAARPPPAGGTTRHGVRHRRRERLPELFSGDAASVRCAAAARRLTAHRALVVGVFALAVAFWIIARFG